MIKKTKRNLFLFSFLCAFSAGALQGAHAEKIEKLTKKDVEAFIELTTEMTNNEYGDYTPEEISAYLTRHIDKDARFASTMRFSFPGMPPQDTKMVLDKDEFIDGVEKGEKALSNYESEVEIKKVNVNRRKGTATVMTVGVETGEIATPLDNGEVQHVPVEGVSECSQILKLDDGVIRMLNANCLTTIEMQPY